MKINLVPLFETLLDVKLKNAGKMKDDKFFELLQYDPILYTVSDFSDENLINQQESYSRWLLKMYNNKQLINTTPTQMRDVLKAFDEIKKRKNNLPSNDINAYKNVDEFKLAVETAVNSMTANQKSKQAKRDEKTLKGSDKKELGMYMDGGAELIHNGENWEVWIPHTYEGSKALGRGAGWCTAGSMDSHYNRYKNNGELYIIINKQDENDKYQLFVDNDGEESEFKDKTNRWDDKFRDFVHKNTELLNFFKDVDQVTSRYENLEDPDIDDWSENDWDNWNDEMRYRAEQAGIFEYYDDTRGDDFIVIEVNRNLFTPTEFYTEELITKVFEEGDVDNIEDEKLDEIFDTVIHSEEFILKINWAGTKLEENWYNFVKFLKSNGIQEHINFYVYLKFIFDTVGEKSGNLELDNKIIRLLETTCGANYRSEIQNLLHYKRTIICDTVYRPLVRLSEDYTYNGERDELYAILANDTGLPLFWEEHHEIIGNYSVDEILSYFSLITKIPEYSFSLDTINFERFDQHNYNNPIRLALNIDKIMYYGERNEIKSLGDDDTLDIGDMVNYGSLYRHFNRDSSLALAVLEFLADLNYLQPMEEQGVFKVIKTGFGEWLGKNITRIQNEEVNTIPFPKHYLPVISKLLPATNLDESINKEIQTIINLGKLKR